MAASRFRRVFRVGDHDPRRAAADMDEEVAFHIAERTEQLVARGWTADAARAEALRRFGPFDETMRSLHTEATRREESLSMRSLLQELWSDARFGFRQLARYPAIGAAAIAILAIGIGATTAIFTLVKHTLIDPLPFVAQDRLVYMTEEFKGSSTPVSFPNFADWRDRVTTLDALESVTSQWSAPVLGADEPLVARTQGVSRGLFQMLGVQPIVGRVITPEENRPGAPVVVVVSEAFWRSHLGAVRDLSSVTLTMFGSRVRVLGVMPKSFHVLANADVWFPEEIQPIRIRGAGNYWVIGRLKPGVSLSAAQGEMNRIAAELKRQYGDDVLSTSVPMSTLRDRVIGRARKPLEALLGAAMFVLIVTCVNVTMILLARGAAREREMAVRVALGADRWRLVRQTLGETASLAVLGVAGGMFVAWVAVATTRNYGRGQLPRLEDLTIDASSLAFAVAVAVIAVVIFSMIPALASRRFAADVRAALVSGGSRPSRAWNVLVAVQSAATVVVALGATLIVRSVINVVNAEVGYHTSGVTVARFSLPSSYRTKADALAAFESILTTVAALPGVESAGLTSQLPTESGSHGAPVLIPPVVNPSSPREWALSWAGFRVVTPGYFATLGIPLLEGRMLTDADRDGMPGVALVNHTFAERLWPGQSAVGKQIRALVDQRGEPVTIVGIVGDARDWRVDTGKQPEMYMTVAQRPEQSGGGLVIALRSRADGSTLAREVRARIHAVDAKIPSSITTLDAEVRETDASRRFIAGILVAFGGAVLLLTVVGVFGSVSYAVVRRTRELGIRVALGAAPRMVWADVQRRVLGVVAIGLAVGAVISAVGTRLLGTLLYGVSPHDATSLAVAVGAVLAAGFIAAAGPATRAARIDPSRALNAE